MSLDTRFRPATLQQMVGNKTTIAAIQGLFDRRENFPHALLISGPTGCGKTTIGRIITDMLGAKSDDYREIDSAQFNGIDTVREIKNQMRFKPRHPESACRVWLIDECFPAGTMIRTPSGEKAIEKLFPGDELVSLNGVDKIISSAVKSIPLSRLIKLNFKKQSIITTKEHLFFTDHGWVKAEDIKNSHLIYLYDSYNMDSISSANSIIGEKNGRESAFKMSSMQRNIDRQSKMEQAKILFKSMFRPIFEPTSRNKNRPSRKRGQEESRRRDQKSLGSYESSNKRANGFGIIRENETEESIALRKNNPKNKRNKTNKWHIAYLARRTWWQWQIERAAEIIISSLGLENRTCYSFSGSNPRREEEGIYKINGSSDLLQGRYRQSGIENRDRDRRIWSQIETEYLKRSKENKNTQEERLEYSEVYKRGSNDRSFQSIIGDKERNSGFIKMYDLQVETHPSYFANGFPVHNCHMLGTGGASEKNKAQNAILKMLEDAPSHVYFILCTTDPQRLLPTVRGRCTSFEVSTIDPSLMAGLIKKTARREKSPVSDAVVEMIVEKAGGHPRNAMKLLEKVIGLTEEQAQEIIDEEERFTSEGIELCRELLKAKSQTSWPKIAKILTGLKDQDEEGIRRLVLSYCNTILLKQNSLHAFLIMDEFSQPFYDTGKAGLTLACYKAVFNDERTDITF